MSINGFFYIKKLFSRCYHVIMQNLFSIVCSNWAVRWLFLTETKPAIVAKKPIRFSILCLPAIFLSSDVCLQQVCQFSVGNSVRLFPLQSFVKNFPFSFPLSQFVFAVRRFRQRRRREKQPEKISSYEKTWPAARAE